MKKISSTQALNNFYSILKEVNQKNTPIEISNKKLGYSAILISKSDWLSIQETLLLNSTGVANEVLRREKEDEFVPLF